MESRERWLPSPIGPLRVVAEDDAIVGLYMEDRPAPPGAAAGGDDPLLDEACRQLAAWFDGERTAFDLPLRPRGTAFQRAVWAALEAIPYGETRSYSQIAAEVGRPSAVRAIGAANGQNPIAVVVPCHRVIGADGSLTGYGGGLDRKRWLLGHERQVLARSGAAEGAQSLLPLQAPRGSP